MVLKKADSVVPQSTVWGPLFAPIISGYTTTSIGWRWTFWIALIYAGFTFLLILTLPETYGPVLLSNRAKKMRKENPESRAVAPHDLETIDFGQLVGVVLTRPLRMLAAELIVSTTCAYLALVYTTFYMSFEAFPIIFQDLYKLTPGQVGLAYLSVGIGAMISLPIFWYWDDVLAKARARGAPWVEREEYRRLPLAVIGGPTFVISLFWLGFSARSSVSVFVPMLAGIPFGMGFMLIFMAPINYLTDAYEIFAASANAAASTCRSTLAVVLPLATSKMFANLGIAGACSLLGGLAAGMCVIPFVFIWKGPTIRAGSKFCLELKKQKEELAHKSEKESQRAAQRARREKDKEEAV